MWRKDVTLARLIVATLISLSDGTAAGSCSSAKLCCQGRDSGCVIQKESPNAIIQSPRDKPCYCDHACLKLADCCDDFKETCGVVDCAVSEWSPWSPCDNGCGSGTQRRSRVIEISEKNGGKHCPRLDQVRTCRSFQTCHAGIRSQPHAKSVTLLALFPGEGNSTDVRIKDRTVDKSDSCVAFTIVRVSRACSRISDLLSEGSRICVERPGRNESLDRYVGIGKWKLSTDIAGSGRRGRPTNSTCHGKWIGDSRLLVDCHDPRCTQTSRPPPYASQLYRGRSRRGAITQAVVGNADADDGASRVRDRLMRRRRRGRRRKRSRRRRRAAVAER
ncbi:somatomedin-B and thrombospondin type-1 domain-containing protein [Harpegnathos saltator]|uniref:somatomedin-B and thrombospondin type-1 domain-containing protein n=1 Tax=Harpegnathos saltator TaxID=610380 RepID=UPI00058F6C4C|nr:somatomedin-B and thrombospondin type-1 domain-containing protein [Harpegnathos saltator]